MSDLSAKVQLELADDIAELREAMELESQGIISTEDLRDAFSTFLDLFDLSEG